MDLSKTALVDRITIRPKDENMSELIDGLMFARALARVKKNQLHRGPLSELLRQNGAIILNETPVKGGFDAVVMTGSSAAGVVDARGKQVTVREQMKLLARSASMGFSSLMVVHSNIMTPMVDGVLYCLAEQVSDDVEQAPEPVERSRISFRFH